MIKEIMYCDVCGCKMNKEFRRDYWRCQLIHEGSCYGDWMNFLHLCEDCFDVQIDYFREVLRKSGFQAEGTKDLTKEEKQKHIANLKECDDKIKDFEDHNRGG